MFVIKKGALFVSRDQYHREMTNKQGLSLLSVLKIIREETEDYSSERVIAEGRAKKFPRARANREDTPYYYFDEFNDMMVVEEMTVHMNVHGDLINGCDWSYNSQKDHTITNVNRKNFMEEFIAYVKEHGEQQDY